MPARQDDSGWLIVRLVREHLTSRSPETPVSRGRCKKTRALSLLLCGLARSRSRSSSLATSSSFASAQVANPIKLGTEKQARAPLDFECIFSQVGASHNRQVNKQSSTPTTRSDKSERLSVTISTDLQEPTSETSQVRIVVEHNQQPASICSQQVEKLDNGDQATKLAPGKLGAVQAQTGQQQPVSAVDVESSSAGGAGPPVRALPPNNLALEKRRPPSSADSRRIGAQRKAWQLNELLDQYGRRKQAAARTMSASRPTKWHLDSCERPKDWSSRSAYSNWRSNSSQQEADQLPEHFDRRFYIEEHWTQIVPLTCCTASQDSSSELESGSVANEDLTSQRNLKVQQDAIWELLTTELAYLKRIRVIIDVFLSALNYVQHHSLLCEIDPVRMTSNVCDVYEANRTLWLSHLLPMLARARATRTPLDPGQLREAFLKIKSIFEPYYRYCLEHRNCLSYVKELKRSNELFKLYVTWCESQPECERLRLTDLLAKPMQRLTRYLLLLRAIAKRTDDQDQSACLDQMMTQMSKFVLTVNLELRRKDEMGRLLLSGSRNDSSDFYLDNGVGREGEQTLPLAYLEVPRQHEPGGSGGAGSWRGSAQQLSCYVEPASSERQANTSAGSGAFVSRLRRLFNLDTGAGTFSSTSASVSLSSTSYEEPAISTPPRRLARSMESSWTTLDGLQAMDLLYVSARQSRAYNQPPLGGYLGFHEKLALHNRRIEEEAAARRRLQLRRRAGSDRAIPIPPTPMRRSADRLSAAGSRPRHSSSSSLSLRALNLTRSLTGDRVDSFIHRVASTRRLSSSSGSTLARSVRRKDAPSKS